MVPVQINLQLSIRFKISNLWAVDAKGKQKSEWQGNRRSYEWRQRSVAKYSSNRLAIGRLNLHCELLCVPLSQWLRYAV